MKNIFLFVFLCLLPLACSQQDTSQLLNQDLQRFILEYERFIRKVDRYKQARQQLQEDTSGMLISAFLSASLTELVSPEALAYKKIRLSHQEKEFGPKLKLIYEEGERLAWDLMRIYIRRDQLSEDEKMLLRERQYLQDDINALYAKVDSVELAMISVFKVLDQQEADYRERKYAYQQWIKKHGAVIVQYQEAKANLDKANAKFDQAYDAHMRAFRRWSITRTDADANYFDRKSEASKVASEKREKAYKIYKAKANRYNKPIVREYVEAKRLYELTKKTSNLKLAELELDLERAVLDWDWLKPYIDRILQADALPP